MAVKFKDTININGEYTFPNTDGSVGQAIITDGGGNLTFGSAAAASADNSESVHIPVKNTSGVSISKGTPVYITGETGNSGKIEIAAADAGNVNKMPVLGLLESTLSDNGEGFCVQAGLLENLATATIDGQTPTANQTVYVKSGGGLTLTKPTGTALIQNIAKVARVHGSNGSLVVSAILRTNDIPNLPEGKIWVGDGNTTVSTIVHLDELNSNVGINTITPSVSLDISGTDAIQVPKGLTSDRPTPASGMFRFNTTTNEFEGYNGTEWAPIGGANAASIDVDSFTGDAVETAFTLSSAISEEVATQIYIDGVYQSKDNYSTSGTTLTFTDAPADGASIEVVHFTGISESDLNGSGTTNYISKWLDTDTLTNSIIYDNGTNVGIGAGSSPSAKLDVVGTAKIGPNRQAIFSESNGNNSAFIFSSSGNMEFRGTETDYNQLFLKSGGNVGINVNDPEAIFQVGDTTASVGTVSKVAIGIGDVDTGFYRPAFNTLGFVTTGVERMRIDSSGDLRIGGTSKATTPTLDRGVYLQSQTDGDVLGYSLYSNEGTNNRRASFYLDDTNGEVGIASTFSSGGVDFVYKNAGSERMRILQGGDISFRDTSANEAFYWDASTARLGIGTTSPSTKLHVNGPAGNQIRYTSPNVTNILGVTGSDEGIIGTITNHSLVLYTNATPRMHITSEGNVGIGTTSPTSYGATSKTLEVRGATGTGTGLIRVSNANNTVGTSLYSGSSAGTINVQTNHPLTFATNNTERMRIDSSGNVSFNLPSIGGTRELQFPAFNATNAKTIIRAVGTSDYRQHLDILMNTAQADIAPTPVVRIENSGNVGIGTDSPSEKLEVAGNVILDANNANIKIKSGVTGTKGDIQWLFNSNSTAYASIGIEYDNRSTDGLLLDSGYAITLDTTTYTRFSRLGAEHMRITSGGNVGIGTTGPSSKLHVNGVTQTSGIISLSRGSVSTPAAAGWYRVGVWNTSSNRGGGVIKLSTTGGSFSPGTYVIKAYKNWSDVSTLKLEAYGSFGYINKARVQFDSTNSTYYLEVYKPVAYAVAFEIYFDGLLGYNASLSAYTTGTLPNGTVGGTTFRELDFISTGTSFQRIYASVDVGIGTDSPSSMLHLESASSPALTIKDTTANVTLLAYAQNDNSHIGTYSNHPLVFDTNSAERMRISSGGDITIGSSNDPKLYMTSTGGNGNNQRFYIDGFADGGGAGYGGGFRIHTRDTVNIFHERMRIQSNGNIGIGTVSPSAKLDVVGTIECTSLTETSALRFKENIQEDVDTSIIDKLRPVSYDWKETGDKDYGFIAEEVDELDSILTTKEEDGQLIGIKYTKLIPFLVKKIQEQEERIKQLENGKS